MFKKVLFLILGSLFLLGSLNSVLAAPPRKGSRQKEAQPQIDFIPKPAKPAEVRITDNPRISEFSVTPTSVAQGGRVTFRWRVTPGAGGSPITTIRINIGATPIHTSNSAIGSYVFDVLPVMQPRSWPCFLIATNQIGRSSTSRQINLVVKSLPDLSIAPEDIDVMWLRTVDRDERYLGMSPSLNVCVRNHGPGIVDNVPVSVFAELLGSSGQVLGTARSNERVTIERSGFQIIRMRGFTPTSRLSNVLEIGTGVVIRVTVDLRNEIEETNENNNRAEKLSTATR